MAHHIIRRLAVHSSSHNLHLSQIGHFAHPVPSGQVPVAQGLSSELVCAPNSIGGSAKVAFISVVSLADSFEVDARVTSRSRITKGLVG
jgi:hypothetical protein